MAAAKLEAHASLQVFGKDSFVTLGKETDESRQQWAADMDTDVSSHDTCP